MAFTYAGQYTQEILGTSAAGFAVPLPALAVNVYTVSTTTAVTLYTSRTKGTTTANPVSTDVNGNLTFYADPGQYDIVFTPPGGSAKRITVSLPVDAAESGTYAPLPLAGTRQGIGVLTDSTGIGTATPATWRWFDAWPVYLGLMSKQALRLPNANAWSSVAGQTTSQIFARVQTVLATKPSMVIVQAGVNDRENGVVGGSTDAQIVAAVMDPTTGIPAIAAACVQGGALPVLTTIPPRGVGVLTGPQLIQARLVTLKINAAIRLYALTNHYPVVDLYGGLVDPATGGYIAGLDNYAQSATDGVHYGPKGHGQVATTLWTALKYLTAPSLLSLVSDTADTLNMLTNGTFQAGTFTYKGNFPNSWSNAVAEDAQTAYDVVSNTLGPGKRATITRTTGSTTLSGFKQNVTLTSGHEYLLAGSVNSDGGVESAVQLFKDSSNWFIPFDLQPATVLTDCWFAQRFTPAVSGTAGLSLYAYNGIGVVSFAQVTLIDLTAAGLNTY